MQTGRSTDQAGRTATGAVLAGALAAGLCVAPSPAAAQAAGTVMERLEEMEMRLSAQERRLLEQEAVIERQRHELQALQGERTAGPRGSQALSSLPFRLGPNRLLDAEVVVQEAPPPRAMAEAPPATVGQAPPAEERTRQVAAVPEQAGVLTPRGSVLLEPSIEFSHTSSNRLVYRGVEIVPGVQLGVIDANDADRNSAVFTLGGRYGLTNRLELELRAPYVYRRDRLTTLAQRDQSVTRTREIDGSGLGDIELALRYQLNDGREGRPIFIGSLRAKPPTGKGPYDVGYDEFGVADGLALGSGFWGVESGLTMLYPTDPAVIYGGLSYNYNIPGDVDKAFGDTFIGRVDPGDSISASLGFGLALNPRLSVSLGYSHNYVFPTKTEIGDTTQESTSIQVGSMLMGMSYRLDDKRTISGNFEFGVTSDAPDVRLVLRTPLRY